MQPNNKRKSLKKVKADGAHPFSRRAGQLNRCLDRSVRIQEDKQRRQLLNVNPKGALKCFYLFLVERLLWFKFAMNEEQACLTDAEMHQLIQMCALTA